VSLPLANRQMEERQGSIRASEGTVFWKGKMGDREGHFEFEILPRGAIPRKVEGGKFERIKRSRLDGDREEGGERLE